MADKGLSVPVIGVGFNGTGYGSDGPVWGGELLVGDYRGIRRAAHLRYVETPGDEQAAREPWWMALAYAVDAGCDAGPSSAADRRTVRALLNKKWNTPPWPMKTTFILRLSRALLNKKWNTPPAPSADCPFDVDASLADVRDRVSYKGQAAIELEGLAALARSGGCHPFEIAAAKEALRPAVVDARPLNRAVVPDAVGGIEPPYSRGAYT